MRADYRRGSSSSFAERLPLPDGMTSLEKGADNNTDGAASWARQVALGGMEEGRRDDAKGNRNGKGKGGVGSFVAR